MFLKSVFMIFVGLCSGVGTAAGTFAFLLLLRVIPRLLQKAKLEHKIVYIENIIVRGILFGTILSLFSWKKKWLFALLGRALLTIFGFTAGIFVGCLSVALAEILDVFPIFFRRLHLKENCGTIFLVMMALGKMIGSLFYFLMGYATITP